MVDRLRAKVVHQRIQDVGPMQRAASLPGPDAELALGQALQGREPIDLDAIRTTLQALRLPRLH